MSQNNPIIESEFEVRGKLATYRNQGVEPLLTSLNGLILLMMHLHWLLVYLRVKPPTMWFNWPVELKQNVGMVNHIC